jgi:hypothetical protein
VVSAADLYGHIIDFLDRNREELNIRMQIDNYGIILQFRLVNPLIMYVLYYMCCIRYIRTVVSMPVCLIAEENHLRRCKLVEGHSGQSKSSRNSSTSTVGCTLSSHRVNRLSLVISTCKSCRGYAMQLEGTGATSGTECGFCITITHRATHRLLCSNSFHHPTTVPPDLAPSDF